MTGQEQIEQLFADFKALHPNNREPFDPTFDNLVRWEQAVRNARQRQGAETKPFNVPDGSKSRQFADLRMVSSFDQFPAPTKKRYMEIAAMFPGRRVYATGSRVTGEYVDEGAQDIVLKMRADLLKKPVKESDYDFTLDFEPGEDIEKLRASLPQWADLVQRLPEGEPKILIPMWDFTKIPAERHAEIADMVAKKQWGRLMDIHNEYRLTEQTMCCNSDAARRWFTWAVENGVIKGSAAEDKAEKK
jgi:hypothetical protein